MRKWLLLLLLLSPGLPAAGSLQAELQQRLHEPAVLRGSFTQSRQIAGFKRPVVSSGRFVVARGKGLLWHTLQPFESILSINADRLRISNGAGQPESTVDARREPMLRTVNELLQGLVIADLSVLQSRFDMQLQLVGSAGWQVALQPREASLRARFARIELAGDTHVQAVRIDEQSGDVTTITFSGQVEDTSLTQAEAGQLQ